MWLCAQEMQLKLCGAWSAAQLLPRRAELGERPASADSSIVSGPECVQDNGAPIFKETQARRQI